MPGDDFLGDALGDALEGRWQHRWRIRVPTVLSKMRSSGQGLLRLLSAYRSTYGESSSEKDDGKSDRKAVH